MYLLVYDIPPLMGDIRSIKGFRIDPKSTHGYTALYYTLQNNKEPINHIPMLPKKKKLRYGFRGSKMVIKSTILLSS